MNHIANSIKNTNDVEMITKLQDIAYQNDVCMLLTNDSEILGGYNLNMNGCVLKSNSNKIKRLMNSFINSNENFKAYRFINEEKKISALLYGVRYNNSYVFIYSNLEDISDFTYL